MSFRTSRFFQRTDQKNESLYLVTVIVLVSCLLALGMMLTGCTSDAEPPVVVSESEVESTAQDGIVSATGELRNIASSNLTYDENTRIVYYKFKDSLGYNGYGFMSPYYGPHGNLCRYENGQVVEMNGAGGVNAKTVGNSLENTQADNR